MRFGLITLATLLSVGAVHHYRHPASPPRPRPEVRLSTGRYGHLFLTTEKVRLNVDGVSDGAMLELAEKDAAGRLVATASSPVLGGTVELGEMPAGWYHVEPNGSEEGSVDLAVARPRPAPSFRDDSMFGVVAPPHEAKEWQMLGDMGAAWLQWSAAWAYMEVQPGVYWYMPNAPKSYGDPEGYVKDANKFGIRTMIQFRTTPKWANSGRIGSYKGAETARTDTYPPDDQHWDALEKFVGQVVDRFKPLGVNDYECWSEAEGSLFNRWNTAPFPKLEAYQKLLQHVRKALRAHDSDAKLGGPGDFVDFLRKAEEGYIEPPTHNNKPSEYAGSSLSGIGKAVDIVTGHFYWTDFKSRPRTHRGPEENNPGRAPSSLKDMMADALGLAGSRPLWISEVGYGSAVSDETPDNVAASEDEQANLLVRYYLLTRGWGAKKIFWYTWKDRKNASGGYATSYGLLRADGTVKPAYTAYRTMTERLEGLPNVKLAEQGPNRYIVHFTGNGRTVVVLWKLRGDRKPESLTLPWPKVRLTHRDGKTETLEASGGKVQVKLESGEPVFLDQAP